MREDHYENLREKKFVSLALARTLTTKIDWTTANDITREEPLDFFLPLCYFCYFFVYSIAFLHCKISEIRENLLEKGLK